MAMKIKPNQCSWLYSTHTLEISSLSLRINSAYLSSTQETMSQLVHLELGVRGCLFFVFLNHPRKNPNPNKTLDTRNTPLVYLILSYVPVPEWIYSYN